jgi:hypothetical protein
MSRPDDKQPGVVPCAHCGDYEGKVACRGCRFLVCGPCALDGCPREPPGVDARSWESVAIDAARRIVECEGDSARIEDVIEVVVETERFAGWGELHYEYRVRIVLGDRQRDFMAVRIRSHNPMRDLDALVTNRGAALARALNVKLRVERG